MSLSRFEETLLRSGRSDAPSAERRSAARAATLRAIGISAAVVSTSVTTSKTATAGSIVTSTSGKLALLLLGAGAVVAVVSASSSSPPAETSASPPAVSVTEDLPVVPIASVAPVSPADSIPVVAVSAIPAMPRASASAPAPQEDLVAVEARLLHAARRCLASGDHACARAQLAEHSTRFARGVLADEAAILAIDIASAEGNRAKARHLARDIIAQRPNGHWPPRVRKLADEPE